MVLLKMDLCSLDCLCSFPMCCLGKYVVFICDLFVSRDDPLIG